MMLAAAAGAAAPATLKGSLTGVHLPAAGKGKASVRAVRLSQGVVAAADFTGGSGSWSLKVPAGSYALFAAVVPFNGGALIDRPVAVIRARSGHTRRIRLSLKRKHKKRRNAHHSSARVRAAAGDVSVGYPAIWVHHFSVSSQDPDLRVLEKGMADMLVTDLYTNIHKTPGCRAVIVERDRLGDVRNEQKLQQLPIVDPGTRVRQGQLIKDNAAVTGTVTERGGQVTVSATYVDRRTGRRGTVSVQGAAGQIFDLEQQLAEQLASVICDETPTYLGQVSGSVRSHEEDQCGFSEEFNYSAGLQDFSSHGSPQPFAIVVRSFTGIEGQGAEAYDESGGGSFSLPPCPDAATPGCSTGLRRRADGSKGQLLFDVEGSNVRASVETFGYEGTTDDCGGVSTGGLIGSGEFPLSMVGAQTITVTLARSGQMPFSVSGSGTLTLRRVR